MYREETSVIKETRVGGSVLSFFKALAFGVGFTILAFLLFSLAIAYTPLGEDIIPAVSLAVMVLSVLICSAVFCSKAKSKGYIKGSLAGLVYVSIIYLLSAILAGGIYFNAYIFVLLAVGVFAGSFGGILGINMKDKRRR